MKIMLDSNIYDELIEKPEVVEAIKSKHDIYITTVQIKELARIPDEKKKEKILRVLDVISPQQVPIPFSFSNMDFASFRFSWGQYKDLITGNSKQMDDDALIADVAIEANCLIVSKDTDLLNKVRKLGFSAVRYKEFISKYI